MNITYNSYPSLLFLSYNKENAPAELPFEVPSMQVKQYLSKCKSYQELFAFIAVKNSIENKNTTTNYHLSDTAFNMVEHADHFRNGQFRNFFENYVKPQHGTILFKQGGQYVYLLLGKNETKKLKNKDGRYIAVALFKENLFIGFEEAIITDKGVDVIPGGHYQGMDIGGYISFCIITLAYANNKQLPILKNDLIKEKIFTL